MGTPQTVAKGMDLFKTLVFDTVVEAAIVNYEGPLLAIPLLGGIIKRVEIDFADYLYKQLCGAVMFQTILFVDAEHRRLFDEAASGLKAVALRYGLDSPEYQKKHEEEKLALKKFGQFNIVQS